MTELRISNNRLLLEVKKGVDIEVKPELINGVINMLEAIVMMAKSKYTYSLINNNVLEFSVSGGVVLKINAKRERVEFYDMWSQQTILSTDLEIFLNELKILLEIK